MSNALLIEQVAKKKKKYVGNREEKREGHTA